MGFAYLNSACGDRFADCVGTKSGFASGPKHAVFCTNQAVGRPSTHFVGVSQAGRENQVVLNGKSILTALRKCSLDISMQIIGQQNFVPSGADEKLRQCREELKTLSMRLLAIQENERRRIASDLHDGIGQSMILIKMSMESVAQLIEAGSHQQAAHALQLTIHKVKQMAIELRGITTELRPAMLDDLGLLPTLSWFFKEFEDSVRDKKVYRDIHISDCDMNVQLKTTIFRIIQEAMHNILKHADARSIKVSLKKTYDAIELRIEDDGCGFDHAGLLIGRASSRGMGLESMKERARSTDGNFDIRTAPGQGTCIRVVWPDADARVERRAQILHKLRRAQLAAAL